MTGGAVEGPTGHLRVMVVEDDPSIAALVPRVLRRLGGTCLTVTTAEEALERLHDDAWDLLVTDLTLPGMDGIGLLEHVRRRLPDLPVLVLTGDVRSARAAQAEAAGARAVMAKPFQLEELRSAVLRLTGSAPASGDPAAGEPAGAEQGGAGPTPAGGAS